MAPQFNLLSGRFTAVGVSFAYGSAWVQNKRTWLALTVRYGSPARYDSRKVVGVETTVYN